VQATTALDYLLRPELIAEAWKYFNEVQTKDLKYQPLMAETDQPAVELNLEKMSKYREQMRKFYYDPAKYGTYLEQLGITYPTLKK
jgi:aminobenzoyl-glutamate utilization protein B